MPDLTANHERPYVPTLPDGYPDNDPEAYWRARARDFAAARAAARDDDVRTAAEYGEAEALAYAEAAAAQRAEIEAERQAAEEAAKVVPPAPASWPPTPTPEEG